VKVNPSSRPRPRLDEAEVEEKRQFLIERGLPWLATLLLIEWLTRNERPPFRLIFKKNTPGLDLDQHTAALIWRCASSSNRSRELFIRFFASFATPNMPRHVKANWNSS
jgi:hypothetical protein